MASSYADGLSPYDYKGKLGLAEKFESKETVSEKVKQLANWVLSANHVVVHSGAGISTAAGIPDFRGPNGVWTLESQGKKPEMGLSFNEAIPTKTHMALKKLIQAGKIHYIISQNIDGLHLRSGIRREYLSELHGNMFIEECGYCKRQYIRNEATTSVGKKCLGNNCPFVRKDGRVCRGKMYDTILDWEHGLPDKDLELADYHSCIADLSISLGTTLQIVPSGDLPLKTKRYSNGKVVICNLQPTKHDKKADLIINSYVDDVMTLLLEYMDLKIDNYDDGQDPTSQNSLLEWSISTYEIKKWRKKYLELLNQKKKRTKSEVDLPLKKEKYEEN